MPRNTTRTPNRWLIGIAGAVVMLTIGTIYSWALFTQPLLAIFQADSTTVTWTFSIANFCLAAVGAVAGGFWQDRAGPRNVALLGVSLWGMGNLAAGLGGAALGPTWLYLTYGVIGGLGAGMAYITPLAMVTKWFPDRKGLVGGLVVGSFGLGAFLYNQCVPRLAGFHSAALHAAGYIAAKAAADASRKSFDPTALTVAQTPTAADTAAVMQVFQVSGGVFLVVGLIAASLFRNPTTGHRPAGREPTTPTALDLGYTPSQIMTMPQFYLLWLHLFVSVISGITILSNALFILSDLTRQPTQDIAPIFGVITIFNALGRVLWGALSDRIGCNHTFAAIFAIQAATLLLLGHAHDLPWALAGFSVILLCCGGGFGTMPSFNADYFGTQFMGLNYGLLLTAWGFAAVAGPWLASRAKDVSGSFSCMLPWFALALLGAVALPFLTRKPLPPEQVSLRALPVTP